MLVASAFRGFAAALIIGATSSAAAQELAAETSTELEPITVTGEKIRRALQDTATSVSVFDARDLDDRPALDSIADLFGRVPNLVGTDGSNFAPAVRGLDGTGPAQGGDAFFGGTRSRLALFVDGRPVTYNELTFGDVALWDVEQVEVLRGPQSTLQGRNAIAGAVVVKTRDPGYRFETGARLLGGSDQLRQAAGYVSGPIVANQLAYRLAVERRSSRSYIHMTGYEGVENPAEFESTMLRGKLLIEPAALDGFSTLLTLNYVDNLAPQVEFAQRPFEEHQSPYQDPTFTTRPRGAIADTTLKLSDALSFENKLALSDIDIRRKAPAGQGNAAIDARELLLEPHLRLAAFDGRLKGFGALYFFRNAQDESIDVFDGKFDDGTRTAAIFGEGRFAVSRALELIFGGRYENETRDRTGSAGPFIADFHETYREFLPKLGLAWHLNPQWTTGATIARGYNGGGAGFTFGEPFTQYAYGPEHVWNYETFLRGDLPDSRLSLQANVFYSDYRGLQLPFDQNPDPGVWSVVIRNADAAYVYGAEFGTRWRARPDLELFADAGAQRTKIARYPNDQGQSLEGHELARAPAFTADAGFSWRHASGFELSADARYSSPYYSDVRNRPQEEVGPYWLVNAQTGYRFGARLRVFAYCTNLFDSAEPVVLDPVDPATPDDDAASLLRPRSFGVGVEARL